MSSFTNPNGPYTSDRPPSARTPATSPDTNPPFTPAPVPRVVADGRREGTTFGYRRTGNYRLQRCPDGAARVLMIRGHGDGSDYLSVAYIQGADREMLDFLEDVLGVL